MQVLRRLISRILSEAVVDDLKSRHPDKANILDYANNKLQTLGIQQSKIGPYLLWIVKRNEDVKDVVSQLADFHKAKLANKLNGKDGDINNYKNLQDIKAKLETIILPEKNAKHAADKIYESENWIVVMPHTQASSIYWGANTTWCTAKTHGQNLFYTYVTPVYNKPCVLYYVINKNSAPTVEQGHANNANSKLSIGTIDGEIYADGTDGHITVNADNQGLNLQKIQNILGKESKDITNAISNHSKKLGSQHPAIKMLEKARKSVDATKYLLRDLKDNDAIVATIDNILGREDGQQVEISEEVAKYILLVDIDTETRTRIDNKFAKRFKDNKDIIEFLCSRYANLVDEGKAYLADDTINRIIMYSPHVTEELLESIVESAEDSGVNFGGVYSHPKLPRRYIDGVIDSIENPKQQMGADALSVYETSDYIEWIASNPSLTKEDRQIIFNYSSTNDKDGRIISRLVSNTNLEQELLDKLIQFTLLGDNQFSNGKKITIVINITSNPSTPFDVIKKLIATLENEKEHPKPVRFTEPRPSRRSVAFIEEIARGCDRPDAIIYLIKHNKNNKDTIMRRIIQRYEFLNEYPQIIDTIINEGSYNLELMREYADHGTLQLSDEHLRTLLSEADCCEALAYSRSTLTDSATNILLESIEKFSHEHQENFYHGLLSHDSISTDIKNDIISKMIDLYHNNSNFRDFNKFISHTLYDIQTNKLRGKNYLEKFIDLIISTDDLQPTRKIEILLSIYDLADDKTKVGSIILSWDQDAVKNAVSKGNLSPNEVNSIVNIYLGKNNEIIRALCEKNIIRNEDMQDKVLTYAAKINDEEIIIAIITNIIYRNIPLTENQIAIIFGLMKRHNVSIQLLKLLRYEVTQVSSSSYKNEYLYDLFTYIRDRYKHYNSKPMWDTIDKIVDSFTYISADLKTEIDEFEKQRPNYPVEI